MKYYFILGSNPTLSIAEIVAVFPQAKSSQIICDDVFILEMDEIDVKKTIRRLGGTIKIGLIEGEVKNNQEEIIKGSSGILVPKEGKFKFGISYYGKGKFNIKPIGMEIKKLLRNKGVSCRWVTSRESTLSSVVVEQNKLTEIVLIKQNEKILIGKTLAVQPFKELSFRDYGRPARDDRSGMIPPKLAQIMINLAVAPLIKGDGPARQSLALKALAGGGIILDPFCGSGTILTEAMLMGYDNLVGSDISEKAIKDTKKNIEWIATNYKLQTTNYKLFNKSVLELSKVIKLNSVDAIITEPYLGPQRGRVDIKQTTRELEELYSGALAQFKKILKPDGIIIMVFPVFQKNNYLNPNLNGFKIVSPISFELSKNNIIKLTNRKTIIYGREGQKVWREIIILK